MNIEQVLEAYIDATNSHQFDQVEKLLTDDAVYWFTSKTCKGKAQIREYFENTWNLIHDEVYRIDQINWLAADEQAAACIYHYQWQGYINGVLRSGSGRGTNVFRKENGEWKIVHEHLSPSQD
jgi:ketosteroid isomerase-like protein